MSEQEIGGIRAQLCQGLSICMRNAMSVTIEIHGPTQSASVERSRSMPCRA